MLTQIDEDSLERLTPAQLAELLAAHEALFHAKRRESIVTYAKNLELPGAPPKLSDAERLRLADRKTRLDFTVKSDREDEAIETEDIPFYGQKLDVGEHHELILEAIEGTIEERPIHGPLANGMDGEIADGVLVLAPPGSAKSSFASVTAPSYLLGKYANFDVIGVSYAAELAKRFGRRVRHVCRQEDFKATFQTAIVEDNQATDQWSLMNGSTYRAVGVLGGVTGFRADALFLDDPIAGREEADSEIIREKTWQAFKDDLLTRLKPGGKVFVILTHWHEDDPAGRILGDKWEGQSGLWKGSDGRLWLVICLPMVAEHADDPLGRAKGEILWHKKPDGSGWFTDRHVELAMASGERTWNSLYQQRPSAAEGNILLRKHWKCWPHGNPEPTQEQKDNPRATEPPEVDAVFLTYDTAFEDKEEADDSAMTAWGYFQRNVVVRKNGDQVKQHNIILLGSWNMKVDAVDLADIVCNSDIKHFEPDVICIEKRASGTQLIQELRRKRPRHKRGYVAIEAWLPPGPPGAKGKRPRAFQTALIMAEGCVWYMPGPASERVRKQAAAFRTGSDGTADDLSDCLTMAVLRSRNGFKLETPGDELDEEEMKEREARNYETRVGARRLYGNARIAKPAYGVETQDVKSSRAGRRLYGKM